MSAAVTLYLGRAGTGKSDALYGALKARQAEGRRALLIVDEQYTFEAERRLCGELGGLTGVQVSSFSRLAERLVQECAGAEAKPFLSAQGVHMAVRRAVTQNRARLCCLGRAALRPGFAASVAQLIRRCRQSGISAQDLSAAAERLSAEPLLSEKLTDLALLYGETDAFLSARYLSAEDAAEAAIAAVPHSFLAGASVYIDGFSGASGQQYRWMEALFASCAEVAVALTCDPLPSRDEALFAPARKAVKRLMQLAAEGGCDVRRVCLPMQGGAGQSKQSAAPLAYLEQNLFAFPAHPYEGDAACVTLFGASDRQHEAEAVADAVLEAARRGVRYRDMAVIVSDPNAYNFPLSRALRARGVPVFLDRARPLAGHSAAEYLLASVSAACRGMRILDVLTMLKTGCTELDDGDIECFEQYVLRYGLRGSALSAPFAFGKVPEAAERVRAAVAPLLGALAHGLGKPLVFDKLTALYQYLLTGGLRTTLEREVSALYSEGRAAEAEESAQVWNRIMELLSQLYAVFGPERMARQDFYELLCEGVSGYTVGVVPGTADQLLLGDLDRTKSRRVRALFLAGANDGLLPRTRDDASLLDDRALARLAEAGLTPWENTDAAAERDMLSLYSALCRATETLFISYAFTGDGGELAPAQTVSRMARLLPRCKRGSDLDDPLLLPSCEREAYALLAADLRRCGASGEASPRMEALFAALSESKDGRLRTARMREGQSLINPAPPVPANVARRLMGDAPVLSASRLERFFACPFSHFVRYGLCAEREKRWEERASDYGSLFHAAMDAFLRRCMAENRDFASITDEEADALLDALLPELLASHNDGFYVTDERARAGLFLVLRSIRQAVHAMLAQIRAGSFAPAFTELRFGPGCAFPGLPLTLADGTKAVLAGVADRVDRAKTPSGRTLIRVVDYKTGTRRFDFTELLHGLSLQLPLYLEAASAAGEAAGLYYAPLRAPAPADGEDPAAALASAFRLKGLTLSDAEVLRCTDAALSGASSVVASLRRNADESYAGALADEGEMELLLERAKGLAQEGTRRMEKGEIAVSPAEGSCTYCEYKDVCRFDAQLPRFRVRRFASVDADAFFGRKGGGGDAVDG